MIFAKTAAKRASGDDGPDPWRLLAILASGSQNCLVRQGVAVLIAGRDESNATELLRRLPAGLARAAIFDVKSELPRQLRLLRPAVVVNTCGPFQGADCGVAQTCVAAQTPYIDLADGRDFVTGIRSLDEAAKKQNVPVVSGASTVPALSSAVLEHFLPQFAEIDSLTYGIAPGQKAERGLATTKGILSYVGKRLRPGHASAIRCAMAGRMSIGNPILRSAKDGWPIATFLISISSLNDMASRKSVSPPAWRAAFFI